MFIFPKSVARCHFVGRFRLWPGFCQVFLALSGLATGRSWLCYFRAFQLGQASRVAPVDKLSVVFAIMLAAIVLAEKLNWHHYLGGALILCGALILAWA